LCEPLFSRPDEILVEFDPVGVVWFFPPLSDTVWFFPTLLVDCTFALSLDLNDCTILPVNVEAGACICLIGEVLLLPDLLVVERVDTFTF
jgi:hypothetical protein